MPLSFVAFSLFTGTANSCCTSMYEKTFPIKVVQSPTHSASSGRAHSLRQRCTAQEVSCQTSQQVRSSTIVCFCWLCYVFFHLYICPVCPWGGEGCLPAAPDHGVRWSVVFCSQRQLSRHCEVTQRFVSVYKPSCCGAILYSIFLKWLAKSQITVCHASVMPHAFCKGKENKGFILCRIYFTVVLQCI